MVLMKNKIVTSSPSHLEMDSSTIGTLEAHMVWRLSLKKIRESPKCNIWHVE